MSLTILGIETSCDETAAGVVDDGRALRSNILSSQAELHSKYGGVVPELASRQHVRDLTPVLNRAVASCQLGLEDVDAVAVTYGPGLAGSLLTGLNAAKAIAYTLGKPLIGVNHLEAHIYAAWLTPRNPAEDPGFPLACLVASGGHTDLLLMEGHGQYRLIGRTRDDAAGEAFDKAARILGLGFPGGPEIQREAQGAAGAATLPRAWLRQTHDFSFSGLKTALLHQAQARGIYPPPHPQEESPPGDSGRAAEAGTDRAADDGNGWAAEAGIDRAADDDSGGAAEAGTDRAADDGKGRDADAGIDRAADDGGGRVADAGGDRAAGDGVGEVAGAGGDRAAGDSVGGVADAGIDRAADDGSGRVVGAWGVGAADDSSGRVANAGGDRAAGDSVGGVASAGGDRAAGDGSGGVARAGGDRAAGDGVGGVAGAGIDRAAGDGSGGVAGMGSDRATGDSVGGVAGAGSDRAAGDSVGGVADAGSDRAARGGSGGVVGMRIDRAAGDGGGRAAGAGSVGAARDDGSGRAAVARIDRAARRGSGRVSGAGGAGNAGAAGPMGEERADVVRELAWAFQESVVDVISAKLVEMARKYGVKGLVLGGGVTANARLREEIIRRSPLPVIIPPPSLCTDNGAMVAACAYYQLQRGEQWPLNLDVAPGLPLG